MNSAIVIINRHEPEGETAQRLLEIAEEKGYDSRTVEAQRGEHDAGLAFRVPQDVADAFNKDREDRWPSKIENDGEMDADQPAGVDGDAYAAEQARTAHSVAVDNAADGDNPNTTPDRKARPGKAKE